MKQKLKMGNTRNCATN